jgi:hypothetical protein
MRASLCVQITLYSVEDLASLGINSETPTTLGWLWQTAAQAASAAARLTTSAPAAVDVSGEEEGQCALKQARRH